MIYALTTAAQEGWGRANVLGTLIAGVLLLTAFFAVEARSSHPLVSLKVLRRRTVALGNIGGLLAFATGSAIVFIGMLFLQQINGLSPLRAGLVFGWLGVVAAISGTVAPRVIGRYGSRSVLVAGLLAQGVGSVLIATMTRGDSVLILALAGVIWVYGNLHAIVAFNVTATSGLANEEQGLATGLATTTQQVALTVGIPILSAIASTRQNSLLHAGRSAQDALVGGFHLAMWADAWFCWSARASSRRACCAASAAKGREPTRKDARFGQREDSVFRPVGREVGGAKPCPLRDPKSSGTPPCFPLLLANYLQVREECIESPAAPKPEARPP